MRTLIIINLLCLICILVMGCGRDEKTIIVAPEPGPQDPLEPPPPPPPPPGSLNLDGSRLGSVPGFTVDMIAEKVLQGDYGQEMQILLAEEVAACLNQMSVENVVSISSGACVHVRSVEGGKGSVLFNYGCIEEDVLAGAYGMDVREALHAFLRGPKIEKL
jgi:hypothetical protein